MPFSKTLAGIYSNGSWNIKGWLSVIGGVFNVKGLFLIRRLINHNMTLKQIVKINSNIFSGPRRVATSSLCHQRFIQRLQPQI